MKKGQFVLVGVLITPTQRSALLRDVQTNKTETVALVGVVRGITLGEVEPTRVLLRQGAESEELLLNVQTGPRPPMSAQAPPGVPPAAVAPLPATPAQSASTAASAPVRPASGPKPPTPDAIASTRPFDGASAPKPSPNVPIPLPKK